MLDLLTTLVDKSLVVADDEPFRVRYRLLETIRQFALARLACLLNGHSTVEPSTRRPRC